MSTVIEGVSGGLLLEVLESLRPLLVLLGCPGLQESPWSINLPPMLPSSVIGGSGLSRPDSVIGENMRWERDMEDMVRGEGDGEGVRWSESREPCSSSSSPVDKYGSSLGRFTVSSTLRRF